MLWGGRPGLDIQVGSLADRRRARLLRFDAALARTGRQLAEVCAEIAASVRRAAEVLERCGLGQAARAARAQADDERRLAQAETAGVFQQHLRVTGMKMDVPGAAKAFLQQTGPPMADREPDVPRRLYDFEEGALAPRDQFHTEWPEDPVAFLFGDDVTPGGIKHSHTFEAPGELAGEVTIEVDAKTYGELLYGTVWPFAVNMGWVAPLGPGGCRHPASAHALVDDCPGWRRCSDCGVTMTPGQAEHAATHQVILRNPDDRTY